MMYNTNPCRLVIFGLQSRRVIVVLTNKAYSVVPRTFGSSNQIRGIDYFSFGFSPPSMLLLVAALLNGIHTYFMFRFTKWLASDQRLNAYAGPLAGPSPTDGQQILGSYWWVSSRESHNTRQG